MHANLHDHLNLNRGARTGLPRGHAVHVVDVPVAQDVAVEVAHDLVYVDVDAPVL